MRTTTTLIVLALLPFATAVADTLNVSVDTVIGQASPTTIMCSTPLEIQIRLYNDWAYKVKGLSNGFTIYSPEGACWAPPALQLNPEYDIEANWDLGISLKPHNITGCGSDTIGTAASVIVGPGLPPGWNGVFLLIHTSVECSEIGKTICIDSSYLPPSTHWYWAYGAPGGMRPSWGGPYCYEIVSCCQGTPGNVDGDPADQVDIADLIYLVDWMFSDYAGSDDDHGPPPPCLDEADIDGSGSNDISDLVYLVDFMFLGGPPRPRARSLG